TTMFNGVITRLVAVKTIAVLSPQLETPRLPPQIGDRIPAQRQRDPPPRRKPAALKDEPRCPYTRQAMKGISDAPPHRPEPSSAPRPQQQRQNVKRQQKPKQRPRHAFDKAPDEVAGAGLYRKK